MARFFAALALLLLAVVIAGVLLAPRLVDAQAERILSSGPFEATVGEVTIDPAAGEIRLADVRIVDEASGKTVVEIASIEADADPAALLRGRLVVQEAVVRGASIDQAAAPLRMSAWLEEVRQRLVDYPAVTVERLAVLDSNARVFLPTLDRAVALEPLEVEARNLRNRPAPEGELPTVAWLTATVPPGGEVRVELETSLLSPRSDFDLVVRGNRLPVEKATEAVEEKTGLKAEGGRANVAIDARLRDGVWNGTISTTVEEVDLKGDSLAEKVVAGIAEAGADLAREAGIANRTTEFDGRLSEENLTLDLALLAVVDDAMAELADVPG